MTISEAELLAYVDGELEAADRDRVAAAIDKDDLLARRVALQRQLRARLNASYNAVLDEAVPQRLLDVLKSEPQEATVTDIAAARAEREAATIRPRRRPGAWSWREWSAVAASLMLGVLLGPPLLNQSQPLPVISQGGRVIATGALEHQLMWRTARDPNPEGEAQVGVTFLNKAGRYCRSFNLRQGSAGLACRDRGEWVIEILARGRVVDETGLRQASTELPDILRQAIDARIDGEPFDSYHESLAIQKRWRK